jgi:hypothetical protein
MESKTRPRYQWQWVGSYFVRCLPHKDYDIIDTLENKIVFSSNSVFEISKALKELNKK